MRRDSFKREGKGNRQRGDRKNKQSKSPQQGNNDFVYPYNFVPVGDEQKSKRFKPIHRFDGLTGRILYKLKTLSPIFIPDPEGTSLYVIGEDEKKDIHKVMDFFNKNGRLCIPSTSIKGMVRSVVEAATNSTFGVFTPEKKPFSYRKNRGNRRIGKWTSGGKIKPWGVAKLPLEALKEAIARIEGKSSKNDVTDDDLKRYDRTKIQNLNLWKIHTGNPVVACFEINGNFIQAINLNNIRTFNSGSLIERGTSKRDRNKRKIVLDNQSFYLPWDDERIHQALGVDKTFEGNVAGFKCADIDGLPRQNTNRVIELEINGNTWKANYCTITEGEILFHCKFPHDRDNPNWSKDYVRVIFETTEPELAVGDDVKSAFSAVNKCSDAPIRPCWCGEEPKPGQIVYYETDRSGQVTEFGPVAMFKSAERASLSELVTNTTPSVLYPQSADKLCPATRLFGWTPEDEKSGEQGIAGRVRFTTAWSDKTLGDTGLVPLKILGSPKPQYYPFYLKAKDGSNGAGYYTLSPDPPWSKREGVIRGRKFYLHHPCVLNKSAEEETGYININNQRYSNNHEPHTNQNSTCRVLPSGAEFEGTIEFESLDPHELGMLLWCLTLSDNPLKSSGRHAHKIGMGKGIGMGSVRFEIEGVCLEEPERNWFDPDSIDIDPEYIDGSDLDADDLKKYVMAFKRWLTGDDRGNEATVNSRFNSIDFISDLRRILNLNLVSYNTPIQYYPPNGYADRGFEYFMNQRGKRNKNEEETLKTPSEIKGSGRQHG